MREIKFRAWHKVHREWLIDSIINQYISIIGGEFITPTNVVLQQFTGLHDKNGKEIYEGDIWKLGDENYEIVWKEGDWQTGWKKKTGNNFTDIGIENSASGEVIGNILFQSTSHGVVAVVEKSIG